MELIGIILSVPFCFVATIVGTYIVRFLISRFAVPPRLVQFVRLIAALIVAIATINILISIFIGACEVWKVLGSIYSNGSPFAFLLAPPSLVFILATTSAGYISELKSIKLTLFVVPFCFFLIIDQYERADKLLGIDYRESPEIACSR